MNKGTTGMRDSEITILVVDDTKDNLVLMDAMLKDEGFESILLADSGRAALDILAKPNNVGVVLLDLMMPEMDGYEVCSQMTSNVDFRHIPIIVVTGAGYRQNDALLRSFAAGAMDFINKPVNEIELFGRVRVALDLYRERVLRQASLKQISDNEARFRSIINQAPVGMAHCDEQGMLMLINDSLSTLLGFNHEELMNIPISELCTENDCIASIASLLEGVSEGFVIETRLRHARDEPVWVSFSASRLLYPGVGERSYILIFEDITERRRTADQVIERIVYYDALTQLPNRVLFNDELVHAIDRADASNSQAAVLFLDLDNFKNINDSRGHVVGDHLLKSVAARIQECIRGDDVFARFGGDEFTLLLPQIHHVEDACLVAQKILDEMQKPLQVEKHEFYVGASIGISFYPQDGGTVEDLVKSADTAMYRAKDLGGLNYQLFNPGMDEHVQQRLSLEQDLRRSLEQGDFRLHYQPQVDLQSMKIIGVEALLRWQHPTKGLLGPGEFLQMAEETGLIITIGEWVMREACSQAKVWQNSGYNDLTVHLNLSRRQFQQTELLNTIGGLLDEFRLSPKMLGIEITESINSLDTKSVIETLQGFRDMNIRTAIDDFGMGYSSLNNLKHFPLDSLKIDKSFIRDALYDRDDHAIIRTIVALGQSFELEVIAEGVENASLLEFVRAEGCDTVQGYYTGEPLTAAQTTETLGKSRHFTIQ